MPSQSGGAEKIGAGGDGVKRTGGGEGQQDKLTAAQG